MGLLENRFDDNIVVEKLDKLLSWARSTSPWFFQFGTVPRNRLDIQLQCLKKNDRVDTVNIVPLDRGRLLCCCPE